MLSISAVDSLMLRVTNPKGPSAIAFKGRNRSSVPDHAIVITPAAIASTPTGGEALRIPMLAIRLDMMFIQLKDQSICGGDFG
jgi:hypothetical protein